MTSIADSSAFFDRERLLTQHQAALTLLQGVLARPVVTTFRWLDLATGRGQIIVNLNENLSSAARKKIHFLGYDIDSAHVRGAERTASSLGLGACKFVIGEISSFHQTLPKSDRWDFITLTNTVHEIAPSTIALILVRSIERLSKDGCLFIYDMEQLPEPELGAIAWTRDEIRRILMSLCQSLGSETYEPEVGKWRHKSCFGWNVQLRPADMNLPEGWSERIDDCIETTGKTIQTILLDKQERVRSSLESLTRCGPETGEEEKSKIQMLYDFWSIQRVLEASR